MRRESLQSKTQSFKEIKTPARSHIDGKWKHWCEPSVPDSCFWGWKMLGALWDDRLRGGLRRIVAKMKS